MRILILGATGFIGNAIFLRLVKSHTIIIGGRTRPVGFQDWIHVDFLGENKWEEILSSIDLVINAVGIIEGDFQKVQSIAPLELYKVCLKNQIRVIHFSAIGAEKTPPLTEFLSTKKTTDDFLADSGIATIIYPGVVIGAKGKSAQFFKEVSQFPLIGLFTNKPMLFVHINQLVNLCEEIVIDFSIFPTRVFAVCKPEPLRDVFDAIKGKPAFYFNLPPFLFDVFFTVFPRAKIGVLTKDTFKLSKALSSTDYEARFEKVSESIVSRRLFPSAVFPQLFALWAIAFLWLWTAFSSVISWDQSYQLMQEIGANPTFSVAGIWAGTLVDLFLGIAIFSKKHRKLIIIFQMLIMCAYMVILSALAPHYWIHPFGVLSKNIPLIALSYYLYRQS